MEEEYESGHVSVFGLGNRNSHAVYRGVECHRGGQAMRLVGIPVDTVRRQLTRQVWHSGGRLGHEK